MKDFAHRNAGSIEEAVALLRRQKGKAKLNAGGTDLIGLLKTSALAEYPELVINIKGIKGLDYLSEERGRLRIGALTRLNSIAESPAVRRKFTVLADAARSVATPEIRNMATIGGNLAQEVRCWYYRYPEQLGGTVTCLRKGGSLCNAVTGDNRYHSIFLDCGCLAASPSDIGVALVALGGRIITTKRRIDAAKFFAPDAMRSTVLDNDEMITEIRIANRPGETRQRFLKFTLRKPVDFAIVSVASVIAAQRGICSDARIALGAVAAAPFRAKTAEGKLIGKRITERIAAEAAEAALEGAKPLSRNGYKLEITRTLVKRAILDL